MGRGTELRVYILFELFEQIHQCFMVAEMLHPAFQKDNNILTDRLVRTSDIPAKVKIRAPIWKPPGKIHR